MLRFALIIPLAIVVALLWMPLISELLSRLMSRFGGAGIGRSSGEVPRLLFLVPAHDEELMIGRCVRSLLKMEYPESHRRVVVIADNCSDATAIRARLHGAEVLDRYAPDLPGKPRALAWAIDQIDLSEWDACVIVDADSTVAKDFARGLAKLAPLNDIVFQPNNLVLNEFDNWLTRLGGLLGRSRFEVSYPLKQAAGLNCPISNGMGIGTNLLLRDGWRSFSITEDTELYAVYTVDGVAIRHASTANLFSQEAHSLKEGGTQRRRWIAGRFGILREWGPRILRSPHIGLRQKLDALVELALPAPVLHIVAVAAVAAAAVVVVGGASGWLIAALALASLAGIVLTTITAIVKHPQPWRTASSFLMLPVYAAWRLVVLLATVSTLRDRRWRRTARDMSRVVGPVPIADPRA